MRNDQTMTIFIRMLVFETQFHKGSYLEKYGGAVTNITQAEEQ